MPKEAPECERQGGGNLRIPKLLLEALVVVEVRILENNMDPKLPKPRKGEKEKATYSPRMVAFNSGS